MKNSVKLIFASALMLTAVSCAKDVAPQVPVESPVRFDVGVDGTKAVLVNSETETAFTAEGFKVTAYEGTTKKMDNVAVTKSGNNWTYTGEYLWKKNTTMRFFGYYPQALAGSLTTTDTGISAFTYSPLDSETAAVKGQTDYMLATYNGQGNAGVAPLNFTHPQASVKFKVGTFDASVTKIKSIAIGGFYKTATCTPTAGDTGFTYAWSGQSGYANDGALPQSGLNLTLAADAAIGTPFLLIPGQQFTAEHPLTVLLTVTLDGEEKQLYAAIVRKDEKDDLVQGYTTTYTINYEPSYGLQFSASEITPWSSGVSSTPVLAEYPEGALPGVFTVNASGKKVYFSKGNLQYRHTANGSGTDLSHQTTSGTKPGIWRFAEEQWHTVGDAGTHFGNVYETIGGTSQLCTNLAGFNPNDDTARAQYCGWIDMFHDCSSGYDNHNPWDVSTNRYGPGPNNYMGGDSGDPISGTDWDWGHYNAISNGGDTPGLWRTPVIGELDYLLISRQNTNLTIGSVNHVNAVGAFVEGIAGIMIFPDGFSWPSGLEMRFSEGDILTKPDAYSTQNTEGSITGIWKVSYSGDEFQQLENAGVLFLPECMCWKLNDHLNFVGMPFNSGPVYGYYWESNGGALSTKSTKAIKSPSGPSFMNFQFYGSQGGNGYGRYWDKNFTISAISVRLVTDAN